MAPAAVFEGDIVVTGTVHSLEKKMPAPPPAPSNTSEATHPPPERGVYRDVHSGTIGRCGPWFVGMRNKGLYVSNDNITLASFEKLRGTCCVYPRRTECSGWEGTVAQDSDGADKDDIPELRRRQKAIYDSVSLDEARRLMDRSSYFVSPSQTLQSSGMPVSIWNTSSGKVWLSQATLDIPDAVVHPDHPADELLQAYISTPTSKITVAIVPRKTGLLPDTGTFFLDGSVFGFMPAQAKYAVFPSKSSHRRTNCTDVVDQALKCLNKSERTSHCGRDLYRQGAMECCGSLADSNIMIHCSP